MRTDFFRHGQCQFYIAVVGCQRMPWTEIGAVFRESTEARHMPSIRSTWQQSSINQALDLFMIYLRSVRDLYNGR